MGVILEDQEKIIRLAEIDVLEMLDVLKTCDRYLDKIPDGLLSEKYDLKFSIDLDKHRNEVKNVDDRLLQLKLSDQHLNTEIRQLRFFLKQNESIREDIMENSKYLSK